jgi:glycosyltransferase involved in cell wall biosynthesis
LEHALHTCVIQDYDNLEILVSDNFSQDRTREVVESYKDPRIRYINTGKRLSMTDNFEFALSHVRPEGYVIYIGDDDGLLPNAIRDMNTVILRTGASVLRWDWATYGWPTIESYLANQLFLPSLGSGTTVRDAASAIQSVVSFKAHYPSTLPMLYLNSAVKYSIIKRIMDLSGRFYHSLTPDVYSGFAIAGSIDNFVDSRRPYVIAGTSRHSNGASFIGLTLSGPAQKFLSEDNLPFHSDLVFSPGSISLVVIECFFQARDHLPFSRKYKVDMERMLSLMMEEAASKTQDIYIAVKDAVLRLGQMHDIQESARRAIISYPHREPGSGRKVTVRTIGNAGFQKAGFFVDYLRKGSIYLDCSSLNVKNVYDASLLCDHIFRLKDLNFFGFSSVLQSSFAHIKRRLIRVPSG